MSGHPRTRRREQGDGRCADVLERTLVRNRPLRKLEVTGAYGRTTPNVVWRDGRGDPKEKNLTKNIITVELTVVGYVKEV